MSQHGDEAERLAGRSLDGEYGEESYRLRLATVAQVYATLHLAERLAVVTERLDSVGDVAERLDAVTAQLAELAARVGGAVVALEGGSG